LGRLGSGATRAGMVGHAGVVAGARLDVVAGASAGAAVVDVVAVPRPADGTESPVVQAARTRASATGTARLIMRPCCQP
jgi:hypothetical protein